MTDLHSAYYLPDPSHWPITGSIALFSLFCGAAILLNGSDVGAFVMLFGLLVFIYMLFGWFGTVIRESVGGKYNNQVDVSFRWGMGWFIFSEVMFFAGFFGALFYARIYSGPWLGGMGKGYSTNEFLWPNFAFEWPLQNMPDPTHFMVFEEVIGAWGVPALNTMILLSSGVTVTLAHWMLKKQNRRGLILWLLATILLGVTFVGLQAHEYIDAYTELDLTLRSGIYGTTFFMLTGFHGAHVTLGAIMLTVIWGRALSGHFTPQNHFAFEAVAWYWHFVDVVWLFLFVFVYWL
jgi:cytochrome c oxidase subunit 3